MRRYIITNPLAFDNVEKVIYHLGKKPQVTPELIKELQKLFYKIDIVEEEGDDPGDYGDGGFV